jgi:hypothetical protein
MFLTKRVAWSGNFEELLTDTPREESDMPMHLPDAPPPQKPWSAPPAALPKPYPDSAIPACSPGMPGCPPDTPEGRRQLGITDEQGRPNPQHCGLQEATCNGLASVNVRQRRYLKLYSKLAMTPEPDYETMTHADAEAHLSDLWRLWQTQGAPVR